MQWRQDVVLRDGEALVMRSLAPQDAKAVLDVMRRTSEETDNMSRYPDEIAVSEEQEAEVLQGVLNHPRGVMLGAFLGDELAGMCSVMPVSSRERMRHRGGLGVSVLRAHWHRGIATALMKACIEAADQAGYEQIELDVVMTNERAQAIYARLGFEVFGLHKRAMRYRDGRYADLLLMALDLRA